MNQIDRHNIEQRMKELEKEIRAELEHIYRSVDSQVEAFSNGENYSAAAILIQAMAMDQHMIEHRTLTRLLQGT